MFDLIIRNGQIIDGSGKPSYEGDIGVKAGKITAIASLQGESAVQTIEAQGKVVAPGFIDVHNHSDGWLLQNSHFWPKTSQGFTTEVLMADGISYAPTLPQHAREWIHYLRGLNGLRMHDYTGWESLNDYVQLIHKNNVQNFAIHIPYANVRVKAAGWNAHQLDDYTWRLVEHDLRCGMELGAVGLSTGLDYISQCHASTEELIKACQVIAEYKGLYVSHIRYKQGLFPALREAVEIGKRSGVKVHVSHLKATSPEQLEELLQFIDRVAMCECDFSFDIYPYLAGSTMLNYWLPYEVWNNGPLAVAGKLTDPQIQQKFAQYIQQLGKPLDQLHLAWTAGHSGIDHIGQTLADYVAQSGQLSHDCFLNLLWEDALSTLLVIQEGEDRLVYPLLKHEAFMLGTDGIYQTDSVVHPRVYGSTGRMLGTCVRDEKLFSLENAVHKMTGKPAQRFGLAPRGVLQVGHPADIVIFDAEAIADQATYSEPHAPCDGIEHVIVQGEIIVAQSEPCETNSLTLPGQFVAAKF
jgi:N-acyl-D-amino-acid deacylase